MKTKLLILVAAFCLAFTSCKKETKEDVTPVQIVQPVEELDSNLRDIYVLHMIHQRRYNQYTNTFHIDIIKGYRVYSKPVFTYIELNDFAKTTNKGYKTTGTGIDTARFTWIYDKERLGYIEYQVW